MLYEAVPSSQRRSFLTDRRGARLPRSSNSDQLPAFSLVELVIVVTIIGIIASIAVPRLTSVAHGSKAAALEASLTNVRKAIDTYYAEHGQYPGHVPGSSTPDNAKFVEQLTRYTDTDGNPSTTPGGAYKYGPYLRPPFPHNPVNKLDTVHVKATPAAADPANGSVGWVAVLSHGYFGISATDGQLGDIGVVDQIKRDLVRAVAAN